MIFATGDTSSVSAEPGTIVLAKPFGAEDLLSALERSKAPAPAPAAVTGKATV